MVSVVSLEINRLMRLACFVFWAPMLGIVGEVIWMRFECYGMKEMGSTARENKWDKGSDSKLSVVA